MKTKWEILLTRCWMLKYCEITCQLWCSIIYIDKCQNLSQRCWDCFVFVYVRCHNSDGLEMGPNWKLVFALKFYKVLKFVFNWKHSIMSDAKDFNFSIQSIPPDQIERRTIKKTNNEWNNCSKVNVRIVSSKTVWHLISLAPNLLTYCK